MTAKSDNLKLLSFVNVGVSKFGFRVLFKLSGLGYYNLILIVLYSKGTDDGKKSINVHRKNSSDGGMTRNKTGIAAYAIRGRNAKLTCGTNYVGILAKSSRRLRQVTMNPITMTITPDHTKLMNGFIVASRTRTCSFC